MDEHELEDDCACFLDVDELECALVGASYELAKIYFGETFEHVFEIDDLETRARAASPIGPAKPGFPPWYEEKGGLPLQEEVEYMTPPMAVQVCTDSFDGQMPAWDGNEGGGDEDDDGDHGWFESHTVPECSTMTRNVAAGALVDAGHGNEISDSDSKLIKAVEAFRGFVVGWAGYQPFPEKEVVAKAAEFGCTNEAAGVLVEALIAPAGVEAVAALAKHKGVFCELVQASINESVAQRIVLEAVEEMIEDRLDTLLPHTLPILDALYKLDIVEDDVFLIWHARGSNGVSGQQRPVQNKANSFIAWLNQSDSEEEEEEEGATDSA
jgi:hypothetical protein